MSDVEKLAQSNIRLVGDMERLAEIGRESLARELVLLDKVEQLEQRPEYSHEDTERLRVAQARIEALTRAIEAHRAHITQGSLSDMKLWKVIEGSRYD